MEEENNVVTVRMQRTQSGELVISVPADTSLKLRTMHGEINVEGVKGELDVSSMNGADHLDERLRHRAGQHA